MVIFDCNGVLVDSEPIASAVIAAALQSVDVPLTAAEVGVRFHGRRIADIVLVVEKATRRKLPAGFAAHVTTETLRRFRAELRAVPHAAHALSWLRGPKAVASSSAIDRIRASLEVTNLIRFFKSRLFSAQGLRAGKPAPDCFSAPPPAWKSIRPHASWSRIRSPALLRRTPPAWRRSVSSAAVTATASWPVNCWPQGRAR